MLTDIISKADNLNDNERKYLQMINNLLTSTQVNRTGDDDTDFYICPNCKKELVAIDSIDYYETENYCSHCGQALDWNGL